MGLLRHSLGSLRSDVGEQRRRSRTVKLTATGIALALAAGLAPSAVDAEPLSGADGSTVQREPLQTPETLGDGAVDGLQYADPTEALSIVSPPEASSGGSAQVSYPILIPPGRGITPDLAPPGVSSPAASLSTGTTTCRATRGVT